MANADGDGGLTFSDGWLKETDPLLLSFLIIPVQTPLRTVHPYAQPPIVADTALAMSEATSTGHSKCNI